MRLTTKGRHAIDAMIELALRQHRDTVKLAEIADRQQVSISYLELLFAKLRRGGLVSSVRGPGGGYRLARSPHAISMADIIAAVDATTIADDEVVDAELRGDAQSCRTDALWAGLATAVHEYLEAVTLADYSEPSGPRAGAEIALPEASEGVLVMTPADRPHGMTDRALLP